MKSCRTIVLLAVLLAFSATAAAEQKIKFGKPSVQDLEMTVYEPDPEAEAVFLFERNEIWYDLRDGVQLYYEREMRIKVLKESGKDWADFSLPYYRSGNAEERILELKACAVNLVGGKAVKTDLTKEFIHDEEAGNRHIVKFAVPEVRVGTVIDIKYTVRSDFIANIPSVNLQHSIPVKYSWYNIRIPDYLGFNARSRGFLHSNITEKITPSSVPGAPELTFNVRDISNEQEDIPAMKSAPFVYYLEDFLCGFDYEISSIHLFSFINRDFSSTWRDFCTNLDSDERFGKCLRMKSFFDDEVLPVAKSDLDDAAKINTIARIVRSHVKWNGRRALYCSKDGLRSVVKNGIGNSADLNFLLCSALSSAGYLVTPVLLNPRYMGRLPYGSPLADKVNAFVLMVKTGDGKQLYIDASDKNSGVNVLPPAMQVSHARVFNTFREADQVDLSSLSQNRELTQAEATVSADGTATCRVTRRLHNMFAREVAREYEAAVSEDDFIESLEKEENGSIDDFTITGLDTLSVTEAYRLTTRVDSSTEMIMFRPTLGLVESPNPFAEEKRMLPVEFSYPESYTFYLLVTLPEGYSIESLPKSGKLAFGNNDISFAHICVPAGSDKVNVQTRFTMNRTIYTAEEYADLFDFFAKIEEMLRQQVILRKS